MTSRLSQARIEFHEELGDRLLTVDDDGVPSFSDKDSTTSVKIGKLVVEQLPRHASGSRLVAQTAGNLFEELCANYVGLTWPMMADLRPGEWLVEHVRRRTGVVVARFDQYSHLAQLQRLIDESGVLATIIGNDYVIAPDVIIARCPVGDSELTNEGSDLVDDRVAKHSPLRSTNQPNPILHASLSCKWTMRSDRAQNARSEALNLIRNRKGNLPHVKIITAEPLPGRIASLALGTGDIDCMYHIALTELENAVAEPGLEDSQELLSTMVEGRRLRDISDLPLDLAI